MDFPSYPHRDEAKDAEQIEVAEKLLKQDCPTEVLLSIIKVCESKVEEACSKLKNSDQQIRDFIDDELDRSKARDILLLHLINSSPTIDNIMFVFNHRNEGVDDIAWEKLLELKPSRQEVIELLKENGGFTSSLGVSEMGE